MNLLLTGEIGVGKTTVCQKVVELARAHGRCPRGVLTPPLYDAAGAKIGFEALNVDSQRRWLLAHTERHLDGPRIGAYVFDKKGLERAIGVLRGAISTEADLLIVDEIGPLELAQDEGFAPVLEELPLRGPAHVLLVVRPSLVRHLRRRLGGVDGVIHNLTRENRDELPQRIVQELWPDCALAATA